MLMVPYRIPPTRGDVAIANAVAKYTSPRTEQAAGLLTWGADEHVLLAAAAAWWLYCRQGSARQRRNSDHLLLTTLTTSLIPHLLKSIFDQQRPDRLTVRGHLHGVPISGKARDAFPSGHAMHVGALASAAAVLPPGKRNIVWALGAGLAVSRVVLLAHWASDVVAGLALGAATERLLRLVTGFGASDDKRPSRLLARAARPPSAHLRRLDRSAQ
jgi:membrane-associated phospholipid phosphatase